MMRKIGALLAAGLIAGWMALPLSGQESGQNREKAPPVKLKSENKAMTLSVVGTIIPLAALASALLTHDPSDALPDVAGIGLLAMPLGPSLGYFYAGATGRALLGTGIRLAGLAGVVGGSYGLNNSSSNETLMTAFIIAGAGTILVSTIIDLAGVKKAVHRHNLKVQGLQVAFAPLVVPRTKAFGLQARLSF